MNGANDLPTPEQVGILNGRQAALQAATADLLQRGVIAPTASGALMVARRDHLPVTALQQAVLDGVSQGVTRLEKMPDVVAALDVLQRDAVRHGLLDPPRLRRGGTTALALATVTVGFFAVLMTASSLSAPSPGSVPAVVIVAVPFVCLVIMLVRRVRVRRAGVDLRTAAGRQALDAIRRDVPRTTWGPGLKSGSSLGHAVALYGTRPMLVAFPAAATLGWALSDQPLDEMQRHAAMGAPTGSGTSGFTCSSGSTSDWSGDSGHSGGAWCGSGNSCGAGGSCNSGSCGSSSCGGSSCGSSCGGGGGCSS